jgi:hypothetical protein
MPVFVLDATSLRAIASYFSHVPIRKLFSVLFLLLLSACAGLGGESVNLKTGSILSPGSQGQGSVFLLNEAEDRRAGDRREIGKSTWSPFKFKHSSITPKQPVILDLLRIIKADLESSGYQVNLVGQPSESPSPVLKIGIEEFSFEMWSWNWPYVVIDGRITLSLAIQDTDGRNLDTKLFSGTGEKSCWFGGCGENIEEAIEHSLMTIVMQTKQWFSSESFRKTIRLAEPS